MGKSFKGKISLTRHKNSEHKAVEKTVITFSDLTYTCEYCKKEFSSKLSLNSHKRAHMNEQTNDKEIDRKKKDAERKRNKRKDEDVRKKEVSLMKEKRKNPDVL